MAAWFTSTTLAPVSTAIDQFPSIAEGLRSDGYDGVISLESVYHPGNGDFEAGFRASIGAFTTLFG